MKFEAIGYSIPVQPASALWFLKIDLFLKQKFSIYQYRIGFGGFPPSGHLHALFLKINVIFKE